jgi:hypothetical protein
MPLELRPKRNVIEIALGLSSTPLVLGFRLPSTEERIAYRAAQYVREGEEIRTRLYETRIEHGQAILTEFESGCLAVDGKPVSSDPRSEAYCEDWKDLLVQVAPQAVEALAVRVFEGCFVLRSSLDPARSAKAEKGGGKEPGPAPDVALEGDREALGGPLPSTSGRP